MADAVEVQPVIPSYANLARPQSAVPSDHPPRSSTSAAGPGLGEQRAQLHAASQQINAAADSLHPGAFAELATQQGVLTDVLAIVAGVIRVASWVDGSLLPRPEERESYQWENLASVLARQGGDLAAALKSFTNHCDQNSIALERWQELYPLTESPIFSLQQPLTEVISHITDTSPIVLPLATWLRNAHLYHKTRANMATAPATAQVPPAAARTSITAGRQPSAAVGRSPPRRGTGSSSHHAPVTPPQPTGGASKAQQDPFVTPGPHPSGSSVTPGSNTYYSGGTLANRTTPASRTPGTGVVRGRPATSPGGPRMAPLGEELVSGGPSDSPQGGSPTRGLNGGGPSSVLLQTTRPATAYRWGPNPHHPPGTTGAAPLAFNVNEWRQRLQEVQKETRKLKAQAEQAQWDMARQERKDRVVKAKEQEAEIMKRRQQDNEEMKKYVTEKQRERLQRELQENKEYMEFKRAAKKAHKEFMKRLLEDTYQSDLAYANWQQELQRKYLDERRRACQSKKEGWDEDRELRKAKGHMERVMLEEERNWVKEVEAEFLFRETVKQRQAAEANFKLIQDAKTRALKTHLV